MLAAARAAPPGRPWPLSLDLPLAVIAACHLIGWTAAQLRYFLTSCAPQLQLPFLLAPRATLLACAPAENFVRRMLRLLRPRSRQTSAIAAADKISSEI